MNIYQSKLKCVTNKITALMYVMISMGCLFGESKKTPTSIESKPSIDELSMGINETEAKVVNKRAKSAFTEDGYFHYKENTSGKGASRLFSKSGTWDFSGYEGLELEIYNPTDKRVNPQVSIKSPDKDIKAFNPGQKMQSAYVEPGETTKMLVYFFVGDKWFDEHYPKYKGMRAGPGTYLKWWTRVLPDKIEYIEFSSLVISADGNENHGAEYVVKGIEPVKFSEKYNYPEEIEFPFIDEFGQFNQGEWPGKVSSIAQLAKSIEIEKSDLLKHRGSIDRNQWGGWKNGPQREATGFFRVEKVDGKWWFVDPEGRLFWSHGVTGVGTRGGYTIVSGREEMFEALPDGNSPFSKFYDKKKKGKEIHYNYTESNLYKKYGENWQENARELHHQRLRSWGMNTIANWSEEETCVMFQTPFTTPVHYDYKGIGSKMPDVFDSGFAENVDAVCRYLSKKEHLHSPWNIGFFLNNELHFYYPSKYNELILKASADQPIKIAYVEYLKEKYEGIESLNHRWSTTYSSWNSVLKSKNVVDYETVKEDLEPFYKRMVDRYYSVCRSTIKKYFPNHLYLGSRLHDKVDPIVMEIANKYCDVISYNLYLKSVADFGLRYKGLITRPMMATEFHFGALDRGMFHPGLNYAYDQEDRAKHYYEYVRGALRHPLFIGTHWFQYGSQAFTGRGQDGENFQIGLVDITDNPYPEIIREVRRIGYDMYNTRSK